MKRIRPARVVRAKPAPPRRRFRQYTIRGVPAGVDAALRQLAQVRGKSMNETAVDALTIGLGLADRKPQYRDLDFVAGTWQEDPAFDAAIAAQDRIDPDMWR